MSFYHKLFIFCLLDKIAFKVLFRKIIYFFIEFGIKRPDSFVFVKSRTFKNLFHSQLTKTCQV